MQCFVGCCCVVLPFFRFCSTVWWSRMLRTMHIKLKHNPLKWCNGEYGAHTNTYRLYTLLHTPLAVLTWCWALFWVFGLCCLCACNVCIQYRESSWKIGILFFPFPACIIAHSYIDTQHPLPLSKEWAEQLTNTKFTFKFASYILCSLFFHDLSCIHFMHLDK